MAQLMRGIFFPNSNLIFTVQTYDPGTGEWTEGPDSRFLRVKRSGDLTDPTGNRSYQMPGYGWQLRKLRLYPSATTLASLYAPTATFSYPAQASTLGPEVPIPKFVAPLRRGIVVPDEESHGSGRVRSIHPLSAAAR